MKLRIVLLALLLSGCADAPVPDLSCKPLELDRTPEAGRGVGTMPGPAGKPPVADDCGTG